MDIGQGQRVEYNIDGLKGEGKVVGIASAGQAIIGKTYIIEPDVSIASETYPYSHFACFEMNLNLIYDM